MKLISLVLSVIVITLGNSSFAGVESARKKEIPLSVIDSIWDNARLLSELNDLGPGDTLNLSGITVVVSGKPISIFQSYAIKGGTFQRACTSSATLAQPSSSQADTIIINLPNPFAVGQWLLVTSGTDYQQNSAGQSLIVKDILGDTIVLHNPFLFPMDSGATVIHQFPLIRPILDPDEWLHFEGTVFNGNKTCNSLTYDWRYNPTIIAKGDITLKECIFLNTPTENIIACGSRIENCPSYNLNGSFVHISCTPTNIDSSFVLDNYSLNTNQIPVSVNGHNEGWLTYSANKRYVVARNNTAINGGNACFGRQGPDDFNNFFDHNFFKNFPKRRHSIDHNHQNPDDLSGNTYLNVPE